MSPAGAHGPKGSGTCLVTSKDKDGGEERRIGGGREREGGTRTRVVFGWWRVLGRFVKIVDLRDRKIAEEMGGQSCAAAPGEAAAKIRVSIGAGGRAGGARQVGRR